MCLIWSVENLFSLTNGGPQKSIKRPSLFEKFRILYDRIKRPCVFSFFGKSERTLGGSSRDSKDHFVMSGRICFLHSGGVNFCYVLLAKCSFTSSAGPSSTTSTLYDWFVWQDLYCVRSDLGNLLKALGRIEEAKVRVERM